MGNKQSVNLSNGVKSKGLSINLGLDKRSYKNRNHGYSSAQSSPRSRPQSFGASVEDLTNEPKRATSLYSLKESAIRPSITSQTSLNRPMDRSTVTLPRPVQNVTATTMPRKLNNAPMPLPNQLSTATLNRDKPPIEDTKVATNQQYINKDLNRFFKDHDKTKAVAQIEDDPSVDTTTTLDRRLIALKNQRIAPNTNRLSLSTVAAVASSASTMARKKKIAPVPNQEQAQRQSSINSTPHKTSSKKKAAPKPPTQNVSDTKPQNQNNNNTSNDTQKHETNVELHPLDTVADVSLTNTCISTEDQEASNVFNEELKVEVGKPADIEPSITAIERETITKSKTDESFEKGTSPIIPTAIVAALREMNIEPSSTKPSLNTGSERTSEVAIQYDAPVDQGIQCSGETLKIQKTEDGEKKQAEKLGTILKMFIDKKAEKELAHLPDPRSSLLDSLSEDHTTKGRTRELSDIPGPPKLVEENVSPLKELNSAVYTSDLGLDEKSQAQADSDSSKNKERDLEMGAAYEAESTKEGEFVDAVVEATVEDPLQIAVEEVSTEIPKGNALLHSDSGVLVSPRSPTETKHQDARTTSPNVDQETSLKSSSTDSGHEDSDNRQHNSVDAADSKNINLSSQSSGGKSSSKSKRKKFARIRKSMKDVAAALKRGANSKETSDVETQEDSDLKFESDNWTLGRDQKRDQREEENLSGGKSGSSSIVRRRSSNLALITPKGWNANAVQSKAVHRPISFKPTTGMAAEADLY